jgi:hypothetical protein
VCGLTGARLVAGLLAELVSVLWAGMKQVVCWAGLV